MEGDTDFSAAQAQLLYYITVELTKVEPSPGMMGQCCGGILAQLSESQTCGKGN